MMISLMSMPININNVFNSKQKAYGFTVVSLKERQEKHPKKFTVKLISQKRTMIRMRYNS